MYRYVIHRLLMLIPILLLVSFIIFTITALTPGDPARNFLPYEASQEQVDEMNRQLGFDRPFLVRYFSYMHNVVFRFDLGVSYYTKLPVASEIIARMPLTIAIAFFGILVATIIGVPIGILSAVKQYSITDTVSVITSIFFASTPVFWLGMIFMYVFALQLGILPSSGSGTWQQMVMPSFAIGIHYAAHELRHTRSSMLETIRQDYIRTARAKGASEQNVIWRHALGNALLPIITITGNNFGALIGGAVVIEALFNMRGLGMMLVNGVKLKDVPVVMGCTLVLATFYCLNMLVIDVLYAFVDPRIKAQYAGKVYLKTGLLQNKIFPLLRKNISRRR